MRKLWLNTEQFSRIGLVVNARLDTRYKPPTPILLVERIPAWDEFRFEHKNGVWYAEKDGLVQYYYWIGPENEGGSNGANVPVTMKNKTRVMLKGPWSSRAGIVNAVGFGPCVDAMLADNPKAFTRGFMLSGGAVTLETMKWACALIQHATMVKVVDDGEVRYDVAFQGSPAENGGPGWW